MVDITREVFGIFNKVYRDMGDGTHAEVIAIGGTVEIDPASSLEHFYNVTCAVANQEYSQALPANCRRYVVQARQSHDLRWQTESGRVAAPNEPYATIKAAYGFDSGPIAQGSSPSTLYFASPVAGTVVEIVAWT
jgi:hypothetical protein